MLKDYKIINDSSFNSSIKDVNLFFCDPPYYLIDKEWDKQWKNEKEYFNWTKEWMQLMYNSLDKKGGAYVCIDWRYSGKFQELLKEVGFIIRNRITWKRDKGRGSKTNWKNMHEDIWFVTKSTKYTFNIEDVKEEKEVIAPYRDENGNPKDWFEKDGKKIRYTYHGNIWCDFTVPFWSMKEVRSYAKTKKTPDNKFEKHPTQKPLDLVKKCILASSNEGDLVVDFFLGSGTTAVAALQLNRKFIGYEISEEYCKMAELRIQREVEGEAKIPKKDEISGISEWVEFSSSFKNSKTD